MSIITPHKTIYETTWKSKSWEWSERHQFAYVLSALSFRWDFGWSVWALHEAREDLPEPEPEGCDEEAKKFLEALCTTWECLIWGLEWWANIYIYMQQCFIECVSSNYLHYNNWLYNKSLVHSCSDCVTLDTAHHFSRNMQSQWCSAELAWIHNPMPLRWS
jgi:hypothetical protein